MISIAMATYNGELFIREQLDSILAQTLSDWELIVCDDGSTDNTLSILQEYANNDSRIKIYQNERNLGFKRNFEKAIGLCKREYIALCDQDDIWYPNHLEILLNQIGDNSLSIGNSDIVDADNTFLNKRMSDTDHIHFIPQDYRKLLYREFFYANPFQGASMLLKQDFALKCIPIPDEVHYHDTWISTCACLGQGLAYTYTPITRYRQHGKNITINNHREKGVGRLDKYIDYISKIIKTISSTHCSTTDRFAMAECLKKRFDKPCEDFNKICIFLDHAKKQKLKLSDIKLLWENMNYITTTHSKREFLRLWFLWSHMHPVKLNK